MSVSTCLYLHQAIGTHAVGFLVLFELCEMNQDLHDVPNLSNSCSVKPSSVTVRQYVESFQITKLMHVLLWLCKMPGHSCKLIALQVVSWWAQWPEDCSRRSFHSMPCHWEFSPQDSVWETEAFDLSKVTHLHCCQHEDPRTTASFRYCRWQLGMLEHDISIFQRKEYAGACSPCAAEPTRERCQYCRQLKQ